ncbi:hypothetical protein B4903_02390 [Yersinia frederiksenii]|nr:hypothetical protein B4903_02390 [Yersinia frederiksenii]
MSGIIIYSVMICLVFGSEKIEIRFVWLNFMPKLVKKSQLGQKRNDAELGYCSVTAMTGIKKRGQVTAFYQNLPCYQD